MTSSSLHHGVIRSDITWHHHAETDDVTSDNVMAKGWMTISQGPLAHLCTTNIPWFDQKALRLCHSSQERENFLTFCQRKGISWDHFLRGKGSNFWAMDENVVSFSGACTRQVFISVLLNKNKKSLANTITLNQLCWAVWSRSYFDDTLVQLHSLQMLAITIHRW